MLQWGKNNNNEKKKNPGNPTCPSSSPKSPPEGMGYGSGGGMGELWVVFAQELWVYSN